jgi:hypothetical protein
MMTSLQAAEVELQEPRVIREVWKDPLVAEFAERREEFATAFWDEEPRSEVLRVLNKAADNPGFIAQLTDHGSKALENYRLTMQEKAALLSGDIQWIEEHVGKLDERLKTWLWCRLGQEIW